MTMIQRRAILTASTIGMGISAFPNSVCSAPELDRASDIYEAIKLIPTISGHEHWGSINAIGTNDSGFIADLVSGVEPHKTSLFDLIFDPYSGMALGSAGINPHQEAKKNGCSSIIEWWHKNPRGAWQSIRESIEPVRSVGWYACLIQGIRELYGVDFDRLVEKGSGALSEVKALDQRVNNHYRQLMNWYETAYKKLGIETIFRPVQLEFGFNQKNPKERNLMKPLLRIDHFCDFYKRRTPTMDYCVQKTGIDPTNANEFRDFLERCFKLADQSGFAGTKQLQAYSRPLDFARSVDASVYFGKTSDREKQQTFGNFIVHECARLAAERNWPHQIHVGTHNHPDSNPLPLRHFVRDYPQVKFLLLHCWPYLDESVYLAKSFSNVYIDPCWTPILNLEFFVKIMKTCIGYLPSNKVMLGHDATSVEMAAGSLFYCRKLLASVLSAGCHEGRFSEEAALSLASQYLMENAKSVY